MSAEWTGWNRAALWRFAERHSGRVVDLVIGDRRIPVQVLLDTERNRVTIVSATPFAPPDQQFRWTILLEKPVMHEPIAHSYKGYLATITYDPDAAIYHGQVIGIRDVITCQAASLDDVPAALRDSVEDYLAFCAERGEAPAPPSGPGRELDALVLAHYPDLYDAYKEQIDGPELGDLLNGVDTAPFSRDWRAAGLLLEALRAEGWSCWVGPARHQKVGWCVQLKPYQQNLHEWIYGTTGPHVVALAALRAKGVIDVLP